MHLRNEEIEAQNLAELAESAISLEEKVDLSQIQNAANTKTHSPSLSNEDIHTLKSPKISSPLTTKQKIHTLKIMKSPMILMKSKIKPQFSRKDFPKTTKQIIIPQKLGGHQLMVLSIN